MVYLHVSVLQLYILLLIICLCLEQLPQRVEKKMTGILPCQSRTVKARHKGCNLMLFVTVILSTRQSPCISHQDITKSSPCTTRPFRRALQLQVSVPPPKSLRPQETLQQPVPTPLLARRPTPPMQRTCQIQVSSQSRSRCTKKTSASQVKPRQTPRHISSPPAP